MDAMHGDYQPSYYTIDKGRLIKHRAHVVKRFEAGAQKPGAFDRYWSTLVAMAAGL